MKGQFKFEGDGKELFSLLFIQGILCAVTLGIYTPWAVVKICQYLTSKTTLGGKKFNFKGEGGELFSLYLIHMMILPAVTLAIYTPWGICKVYQYFASKLELDGKAFDFKGEGAQLFSLYLIHLAILPAVTLCIYLPWGMVKLLKYFAENTSYQGKAFAFNGEGGELFSLYLIHMAILPAVTLCIYYPWGIAKLKNYLVSNITYAETDKFEMQLDGAQLFSMFIIGGILSTVTLGIYYPWFICKLLTYSAEKTRVN